MKLAIENDQPIRKTEFPAWPQFDASEEEALTRALRQGQWWRVHGNENLLFEKEFSEYHDCEHALTVNSGTVALEIALLAAGIGKGDEVIVPAFTFISTSMAVQKVGAIPVPVDVMPDTYCISPQAVCKHINEKTKAIIPVHMSGHFSDMETLCAIARDHNLIVIQDSAHAHGARGAGNRSSGDWGSMACFSFQNFKLMTAGEGGIILFPTKELREKAFLYSNCGRPLGDREYQHNVIGMNCRLPEFSAAVLRSQLMRLDQQTKIREANADILRMELVDVEEISLQQRTDLATVHPHYMFMFTLNDHKRSSQIDRSQFVECLIAEGIPAYRAYEALYRVPCFWLEPHPQGSVERFAKDCPVTEHIASKGIWIHHRALLGTADDAKDVAIAIRKVLRNI